MVSLTNAISDQRLLQACFDALALSITTNGARAPWVTREQAAFADREVWQTYFLRPELHSNWLRRKARWQRQRAERLAPGKVTTRAISFLRGQLDERISIERELLFSEQASTSNVEIYWTGAIKLREIELKALWEKAEALIKYLVFQLHLDDTASLADRSRPSTYRELQTPTAAIGLARWQFNACSHRMPKLPTGRAMSAELPPQTDRYYWDHVDELVAKSERLTTKARVANSGTSAHAVMHGKPLSRPQSGARGA